MILFEGITSDMKFIYKKEKKVFFPGTIPTERSSPLQVMPRKVKRYVSGKRTRASGKYNRRYANVREGFKKSFGYSAAINLGRGLPTSLRMAHTFTRSLALGTSLGVPSTYAFRGNDLYDPDFTGVGTQPLYFDQFNAMYGFGSVRGSRIEVEFTSYDDVESLVCIVYPSRNSSGPSASTADQLMQIPGAKWVTIGTKAGDSVKKIVNYATTEMFYPGYSEANNDYRFSSGGSPQTSGSWFWRIATFNASQSSTSSNCAATVRLQYYTTWMAPVVTAFS